MNGCSRFVVENMRGAKFAENFVDLYREKP